MRNEFDIMLYIFSFVGPSFVLSQVFTRWRSTGLHPPVTAAYTPRPATCAMQIQKSATAYFDFAEQWYFRSGNIRAILIFANFARRTNLFREKKNLKNIIMCAT